MATDRTKLLLDKLRVWKNEVDKAMDTNRNIKSRYKRVCKVQEEIRSELDGFIKNLADNTCRVVKTYHGRFIETIDYKYYCQTFYNEKDVTPKIYKCLHLFFYGKRYFIEYLKYTEEMKAECDKKAHIYGKRSLNDEMGYRIEGLSKGGGLVYKISEMKNEKGEYVPFPNWIYYANGPYQKYHKWRGTFEFQLAVIVTQIGKEKDIALWEVLAQAIYLCVALNYEKEDMGREIEDEDSMGANVTTSVETPKPVENGQSGMEEEWTQRFPQHLSGDKLCEHYFFLINNGLIDGSTRQEHFLYWFGIGDAKPKGIKPIKWTGNKLCLRDVLTYMYKDKLKVSQIEKLTPSCFVTKKGEPMKLIKDKAKDLSTIRDTIRNYFST